MHNPMPPASPQQAPKMAVYGPVGAGCMVALPRPLAASLEMLYALQTHCNEAYPGRKILTFVFYPVDAKVQFFCATCIDGRKSRVVEVWHGNEHLDIAPYMLGMTLNEIEECADEMITED